jgi:hypothetical protein
MLDNRDLSAKKCLWDGARSLYSICSGKAEISLKIAPDWDLGEEVTNFLMKMAN